MLLWMFILVFLAGGTEGQTTVCGNAIRFYGTNGTINSPNYPLPYYINANCTYYLTAPGLSNITLTIRDLDLETCCDWVEIKCQSHSVGLPMRYKGHAYSLQPVTFIPCSRVLIRFYSDESITGRGFSIAYQNTPIVCPSNCTLLSNTYGYVCSCNNETGVVLPTMNPNPTCSRGCTLTTYGSDTYCSCSVSRTTTVTCPSGCYTTYDFNNNPICSCPSSTTPTTCPTGCHRAIDETGNSYCRCTSPTDAPLSCPSGCFVDYDYWDNQYCECPSSTHPPLWCAPGCTSDVNVYGDRFCNCPPTTLPPCSTPCSYSWNYTGSTYFQYCYCPPTTTAPPPTGCNQTLTATSGYVTSPNYPRTYPKGIDCYQYIDIPSATAINLRIVDIDLYYYSNYNCMYEYIEVAGCDGSVTIFCTSYSIPSTGLSFQCTDDHKVTVVFTSRQNSYYSSYRGFKLAYTSTSASNCSSGSSYLLPGDTGIITSPNYPNSFPMNSECTNYLYPEDSETRITIVFEQINLGSSTQCTNAFLRLICDGDNNQSMTVCGNSVIPPKTFQCGALTIWFKSNGTDRSGSTRFFRIKYLAKRSPLTSTKMTTVVGTTTTTTFTTGTTIPTVHVVGETDLPMSAKLGIGLGIGIGGFFLLLLLVLIVVLIFNGQRKSERRERFRLEDLAVICSNIRNGNGPDSGGTVRMAMDPSNIYTTEGFSNPLAMANSTDSIPPLNEKMKA